MEFQTIATAIAGVVATGSLSAVGEHITDNVLSKSKQLLSYIENKSPRVASHIENAEQEPIDYEQACREIEDIAKSDPEMKKLLQEMKELVDMNRKVAEMVKYELNNSNSGRKTVIENWKGINNKGGINIITGNMLQIG